MKSPIRLHARAVSDLVCVVGFSTLYLLGSSGVEECKAQVKLETRRLAEKRIQEGERLELTKQEFFEEDAGPGTGWSKLEAKGYSNLFAPTNLEGQVDSGLSQPGDDPANRTEGYLYAFAPSKLEGQIDSVDLPDD